MPGGRPTKYKPEYCDLLIEHMESGLSFEAFGGHEDVGVSKDTLYEWAKRHEPFSDAKKIATERCRIWWEKAGKKGMTMHRDQGTFNSAIWIFNMKNRFGWKDKQEVDHNISAAKTITVTVG